MFYDPGRYEGFPYDKARFQWPISLAIHKETPSKDYRSGLLLFKHPFNLSPSPDIRWPEVREHVLIRSESKGDPSHPSNVK